MRTLAAVGRTPALLIKEAEEVRESTGSQCSKLRWDETRVHFQMVFFLCGEPRGFLFHCRLQAAVLRCCDGGDMEARPVMLSARL